MGTFSVVIFVIICIICIFLAFRCIILTKAVIKYHDLLISLCEDNLTRENLKIIIAAMYGLEIDEIDRRLKK